MIFSILTAIKKMPHKKFSICFCLFNKGRYFSWYVVIIHKALLDIAEKTRCRYPYKVPTQIIPFVKKEKTTSWTFGEALLMAVGIYLKAFECSTTSDSLNRKVSQIRSCVTFQSTYLGEILRMVSEY